MAHAALGRVRKILPTILCVLSAACSNTISGHLGAGTTPTATPLPEACVTYLSTLSTGGSSTPTPKRIFYVASNGNDDNNNGLSESTPWKTIAKVNGTSFAPGDAILFRCDDEFSGQVNASQAGVVFGAYGTGSKKPIISGSERLTNWKNDHGAVWVAQATAQVKDLFANGVQMTLARYPNIGFIASTGVAGSFNTVTADGLMGGSEDWTGATLRIRTNPYRWESRTVSGSRFDGTTTTLTLATDVDYAVDGDMPGWGFYLDNKLEELDVPGEWFCDPKDFKVYFYAPDGVDPNTLTVDGSVWEYGVYGTTSDITVAGLSLRYQATAALRFYNDPNNIRVLSNSISKEWIDGVRIDDLCSNCLVDGNTISDCNGRGVVMTGSHNTISNNTIGNIGLVEGYDNTGAEAAIGISVGESSDATISGNTIDRTGYSGIDLAGANHLIEKNIIKNTMLTLADGGAIYAWGGTDDITYGHTWRNNIIENVTGNITDAIPLGDFGNMAVGLYMDQGCHDFAVEGNTVQGANSSGIFVQYNDAAINIHNNLVYNSGLTNFKPVQILQDLTLTRYGNITFTGNIIYSTLSYMNMFYLRQFDNGAFYNPLTIDNNYYINPYTDASTPFMATTHPSDWDNEWYAMKDWRALIKGDANSKEWVGTRIAPGARPEKLFVNSTAVQTSVDISDATYRDLDGITVVGPLTLAPYSSKILIRQ